MPPGETAGRHQRLLTIVRFALGIGLILWLLFQIDIGNLGAGVRSALRRPEWWLLGLAFTFAGLLTGVFRWRRILAAEGLHLSLAKVFQFAFIGQFFNAFMLGACGGDVARGYYVFRETASGSRAEALSTVFVDRLIGLAALLALCSGVVGLRLDLFQTSVHMRLAAILTVGLFAAMLLGVVAMLILPPPVGIEAGGKDGISAPRRAYRVLARYLRSPRELLIGILYSLGNAACLTLACWAFGRALVPNLTVVDVFTLFPIITVLASIPITPGGLGVRENLFAWLFAAIGVGKEAAFAMSVLVYLGGVFWSAVGGLCFLAYRRKNTKN